MKRYCLALDLIDEEEKITEYEAYHQRVWPEIQESIFASGIDRLEIYRFANRLFMILETSDEFSFQRKAAMDKANPKVQEWEKLMWKFQQPIPGAAPDEKWQLMQPICILSKQ